MPVKELFSSKTFIIALMLMICAGAVSEFAKNLNSISHYGGLKLGLLVATIFPLLLVCGIIALKGIKLQKLNEYIR